MKQDLLSLFQDIEQLLPEGYSLKEALEVIDNPLKNKLAYHIECGGLLSDFIETQPIAQMYKSLLTSAEKSSSLETGLKFIIDTEIHKKGIISKISKSLIYPAIVLATSFVVLLFFESTILPIFMDIFQELGSTPPPIIRVIRYLKYLPFVIISIMGGIYMQKKEAIIPFYVETRNLFILKQISMALNKNISLQEIFSSNKSTTKLLFYLNHGLQLSEILVKGDLLTEKMVRNLKLAEESGKITSRFEFIVDLMEQRLLEKVEKIAILIEPLTVIVIGIFIGVITIALIGPIFEIGTLF